MTHQHLLPSELLQAVKAYALKHYNENGWDYIAEAYDDDEIIALIGKAKTAHGAISNVARLSGIKVRAEVRADIQGA